MEASINSNVYNFSVMRISPNLASSYFDFYNTVLFTVVTTLWYSTPECLLPIHKHGDTCLVSRDRCQLDC